jgi:hypothetical protein
VEGDEFIDVVGRGATEDQTLGLEIDVQRYSR